MAPIGITRGAATAVNDLLDNCAQIVAGDDVVLLAHVDGQYGGDNLVDPQVISWIQAGIQSRGANPTVIWIDEPDHPHAWRVPPVMLAALKACSVFINHSFDFNVEEFKIIQETADEYKIRFCRNFATTANLLNSAWAQTPYELVSEIRLQACVPFDRGGMPYELSDENGTCLTGLIAPPSHPRFPTYTRRRNAGGGYRPFPEWVFPPINVRQTNGTVVFDRMLSWWSRYIGIAPVFSHPIHMTVEDNRIIRIEGKDEADALRRFLKAREPEFGDAVYNFGEIHSGVHPQAIIAPQLCNNPVITRTIEHSQSNNVHCHIGAPWPTANYPYYMHITGDLRTPTWKVGGTLVHDKGHLTALDHPEVRAIAARFPGRPGLSPWPRSF